MVDHCLPKSTNAHATRAVYIFAQIVSMVTAAGAIEEDMGRKLLKELQAPNDDDECLALDSRISLM